MTRNNLLVAAFGKYLDTRQVPRTFSIPTVKKVVFIAWLAAFLSALFPAATMDGIRYDLNGHCHEDFAVLGQFCAKIITVRL